jgi:hypothetical protein
MRVFGTSSMLLSSFLFGFIGYLFDNTTLLACIVSELKAFYIKHYFFCLFVFISRYGDLKLADLQLELFDFSGDP